MTSGPRAAGDCWGGSTVNDSPSTSCTDFPTARSRCSIHCIGTAPRLFDEMKTALRKAVAVGAELNAVGIDTWGVDFGLVGRNDTLLGNPVHYRDDRTKGMMDAAFARISKERIYEITGLQFLPFNTVYQLLALRLAKSPLLDVAETLLMMPDLFAWLFTGRRAGERTDASTTQLLDPRNGSGRARCATRSTCPSRSCLN